MAKVKKVMPTKQYETNGIVDKFTHQVLRLPVAHPELNPSERAWAHVKDHVAKHKTFTLTDYGWGCTGQLNIELRHC